MKTTRHYLTEKEYFIMSILWQSERPLSSKEIVERGEDKIAMGSLHTIINNLIEKSFIEIVGKVRATKVPSRLYAAKISLEEYTAMQLKAVYQEKPDGRLNKLLSFFIGSDKKNDEKLIQELEELIEDYKKKGNSR